MIQDGRGFVVLAREGSKAVAGAVFLLSGSTATYKFAASDPELETTPGKNLVLWEAIRHLTGYGCDLLDFGRTSPDNEGLRQLPSCPGALRST